MSYIKILLKNGKEEVEEFDKKSLAWKNDSVTFINKNNTSIWINLNEVIEIKMWEVK